jgi:hypothetical protein
MENSGAKSKAERVQKVRVRPSTASLAATVKVPQNDPAWVKSYVTWASRVLDKRAWPADKD